MTTLIFDLETDGLLDSMTRIHCLSIYDTDTHETIAYNDEGSKEPIVRGVQRLEDADACIGHNVIGFDVPVIKHFYPWFKPAGPVLDTLVLSRLYHNDILDVDKKRKWKYMPLQLYGRHSLESYGYRLGEYKGNFAKETDWKNWSQEMEDYNIQDTIVTYKLWEHFQPYLTGLR